MAKSIWARATKEALWLTKFRLNNCSCLSHMQPKFSASGSAQRKSMHTRKAVVVVTLLVAAAGAILLYSRYMESLWDAILPARSVHTTDMRAIDITMTDPIKRTGIQLRIPKAYLTKTKNWRGGEQEILFIQTRLPEMKPGLADPDLVGTPGTEEHKKSLATYNNGVHIQLRRVSGGSQSQSGTTLARIHERLSNTGHVVGAPDKYELVDKDYFGLERYLVHICHLDKETTEHSVAGSLTRAELCTDVYREEYVSKDLEKPPVHILCNVWDQEALRHRLGCQVTTEYLRQSLSYIVRYSEMSRWHEFDSNIRKLLDSFVVNSHAEY